MTLSGIIEALGLGAAREARHLVARLPGPGLRVAAIDGVVGRALSRAGHQVSDSSLPDADAALLLGLPDGDGAFDRLCRVVAATREGGTVIAASGSTQALDRARAAGLFVRVGLLEPRQVLEGGGVYTYGQVRHLGNK